MYSSSLQRRPHSGRPRRPPGLPRSLRQPQSPPLLQEDQGQEGEEGESRQSPGHRGHRRGGDQIVKVIYFNSLIPFYVNIYYSHIQYIS